MAERILSIFDSYDFFGKSLPGTALVIGLFPLLPEKFMSSIDIPELPARVFLIVILLLIAATLGLFMGESVHTIAVIFENTIAWVAMRIRNSIMIIWIYILEPIFKYLSRSSAQTAGQTESKVGWLENIRWWFDKRYDGVRAIVLPHRKLFQTRVLPYMDTGDGIVPRGHPNGDSFAHQYFMKRLQEEFLIQNKNDIRDAYPVIVTHLSSIGSTKPFKMQSRHAFCRGMSIAFFILGALYYLFYYIPNVQKPDFLKYTPYLFHALGSNLGNKLGFISIALVSTSFIFSVASGRYKQYYVDYLVLDLFAIEEAPRDDD